MRKQLIPVALLCFSAALCPFTVQAQNIKAVVQQQQLPVLINKAQNKLLTISCYAKETAKTEAFELTFKGTTDIRDLAKIYISSGNQIIAASEVNGKSKLILPVQFDLKDTTIFTVTCDLSETTDLFHFIDAQCKQIRTDKGNITPQDTTRIRQRAGVAVREHKQDGVHTSRIPGIATTNEGSLLAIFDARRESSRDLQGHMDIGLNRSMDKGQTWEPMRIALDMKEWGGLPEKFNGVSDACILVDQKSGKIFIAGLWMHGILDRNGNWIEGLTEESKNWQHQWQGKGSQPGLSEKETSQFLITSSKDDGRTWSAPVNITSTTKKPEWWLFAPAPGGGITLTDGTLVFPTQGRDKDGIPFSNITYSKDGGTIWQTSAPSYTNTTECAVVQLSDNSLMLNMRDNRNGKEKGEANGRAIFTTSDLGKTWQEHPTAHGALQEPVCMASLLRHDYTRKGKKETLLLFSNPNSKRHRNNMTIKVSFDEGKTWSSKNILLDAGGSFGYSCLTSLDENTVGILYESSRAQMVFQRIPLQEILSCQK